MSDIVKAQVEFSNWVKNWINPSGGYGTKEAAIQPDLLDIMTLFKILGFENYLADVCDPNDSQKLKNGREGIKIIATCSLSGMRCVMELETNSCKCPESVVDPKLWANKSTNELVKYTIDKKEVDALITVPFETEHLIQSVANHFLHLIQNNDQNANAIQQIQKKQTIPPQLLFESPRNNYFSRQHTFLSTHTKTPTIEIISPARYRSLDTLTGDLNISEIPEPGKLRKNISNDKNLQTFTSSNANVAKLQIPRTSSPCQNCEPNHMCFNKLLAAQTLISEVLGTMENQKNSEKLNCDISKIQGSIDCLLETKEKPLETTPKVVTISPAKVPPTKPKCRAPIRSTGCLKPIASKSPVVTRPVSKSTSSASATKSLENVSNGTHQKTPIIKPNPKYMHVKSTISKIKTTVTTTKK